MAQINEATGSVDFKYKVNETDASNGSSLTSSIVVNVLGTTALTGLGLPNPVQASKTTTPIDGQLVIIFTNNELSESNDVIFTLNQFAQVNNVNSKYVVSNEIYIDNFENPAPAFTLGIPYNIGTVPASNGTNPGIKFVKIIVSYVGEPAIVEAEKVLVSATENEATITGLEEIMAQAVFAILNGVIQVFKADGTELVANDNTVTSGDSIYYKVSLQNTGNAATEEDVYPAKSLSIVTDAAGFIVANLDAVQVSVDDINYGVTTDYSNNNGIFTIALPAIAAQTLAVPGQYFVKILGTAKYYVIS